MSIQTRNHVRVGPSPRYLDDDSAGYLCGFRLEDLTGLLDSMESNYLGRSTAMSPAITGNGERPELGEELTNSFCRTDPAIGHLSAPTETVAAMQALC
jgi:sigma-B regulation protein RsbQ